MKFRFKFLISFFIISIFSNCTTDKASVQNIESNNISSVITSGNLYYIKGNNGMYVTHNDGVADMVCNKQESGTSEEFYITQEASGYWSIKAVTTHNYVSMENGVKDMICNRLQLGIWELFELEYFDPINGNDVVAFKSVQNEKYVSSENGAKDMICNRSIANEWEKFELIPVNEEITEITETPKSIRKLLSFYEGIGLSYSVDEESGTVTFSTENLPNHTSPYYQRNNSLFEVYNGTNPNYQRNPNFIEAQNITITVPLIPEVDENHEATSLGPIGIARNGVVFFNQYAGPNEQPLTDEIDSFDQWLGHPDGVSRYHYHIEPIFLTESFGEDAFLGLLADGFPVYGPIENGNEIINDDLDEYHGHYGATNDYPNSIYHYHITSEDPYLNGNGFYGTPGRITQ